MIGEILGNRYEIKEKIGEGGMSIVYKARCNKLNRFVAVKILKSEFCDNEEIVKKFKDEATAIATLSDNNIVNVLDVGSQDNINYIVMEYIKGKTLKEVIKQYGCLNYDTAITISIQIAKALDCAHRNKIIHRDVKPQNILVTEEGIIKVTDFGIAKSTGTATITNTTTIMGSAQYFSPEQAKGTVVDQRTDLYSLGVVMYEMVTGRLPFEADSPVSIAIKHIQEQVVPPKQINAKIPESLNEVIIKLMEKDPNNRYQNTRELMSDLQKIKENPDIRLNSNIAQNLMNEGRTIVMNPVNVNRDPNTMNDNGNTTMMKNDFYDDDDDDDYYYDEDEYDENDPDGKKKRKKILIIIGAIVAGLIAVFGISYAVFFNGETGSSSSEQVTVPNLIGMTKDEAKEALDKLGLELEDGVTEDSEEEEGTIIDMNTKSGSKVNKGTKIRVIFISGKSALEMKDFSGSSLDSIKTFLKKNKITNYSVEYEYSDTIDSGCVIRTDPEAGEEINSDTAVTIYVSQGPKVKKYTVPNVVGLTESNARSKLSNFNVVVSYEETSDSSEIGVVISQSDSGTSLESGSTVTIVVGKKKAKETVDPNSYVNSYMTGSQAKSILEGKGFVVTISGDADGYVISVSPSSASSGDKVTIYTTKKQDTSNDNDDDNSGSSIGNNNDDNTGDNTTDNE